MNRFCRYSLFVGLFLLAPLGLEAAAGVAYTVNFEGLDDSSALKTIKSVCQLTLLKKHAPTSINALRYRAEADIPEILKVLHAHGYYEATVEVSVEELYEQIKVNVVISPGPVYKIETYNINLYSGEEKIAVTCEQIDL